MQPPKGGPPLEFINIQPQKGGLPLEFINIQPPKGGPPLEFINIQPLGTISMDLAVHVFNSQLTILALNEELQTVGGKQYTDVSASNYSKFNFEFDD